MLVLTLTLKLAGSQARGLVCSQCLNISFFCSQTLALFFTLFPELYHQLPKTNQGKCWEFRRKANHCNALFPHKQCSRWYKVVRSGWNKVVQSQLGSWLQPNLQWKLQTLSETLEKVFYLTYWKVGSNRKISEQFVSCTQCILVCLLGQRLAFYFEFTTLSHSWRMIILFGHKKHLVTHLKRSAIIEIGQHLVLWNWSPWLDPTCSLEL